MVQDNVAIDNDIDNYVDNDVDCKNQIVVKNLRIAAQLWTSLWRYEIDFFRSNSFLTIKSYQKDFI